MVRGRPEPWPVGLSRSSQLPHAGTPGVSPAGGAGSLRGTQRPLRAGWSAWASGRRRLRHRIVPVMVGGLLVAQPQGAFTSLLQVREAGLIFVSSTDQDQLSQVMQPPSVPVTVLRCPRPRTPPAALANCDGQSHVLVTGLGFEPKTGQPPAPAQPAPSCNFHSAPPSSSESIGAVGLVPRAMPCPTPSADFPSAQGCAALPPAPYRPLSSCGRRDKSNSYGRLCTGSGQPRPPPAGLPWPGQIKG